MNAEKPQVLIIEDDPNFGKIMCEYLNKPYECFCADTAQEGLHLFDNTCQPAVVIVSSNLADSSGIEVCKTLKQKEGKREFAVFIVSEDNTAESRIESFDAGADDYISKPFQLRELLSRVQRTIASVSEKNTIQIALEESQKELSESQKMINIVMTQANQYSQVMKFFKSLNHCHSPQDIAKLFFDTMSFFQLKTSLLIENEEKHYFAHDMAEINPIEKNILDLLRDKGRVYTFEQRTIVNGEGVSFLVKNLPQDESEAGEARDFLASLIEGIEAKLKDLCLRSALLESVTELGNTINEVKVGIEEHNVVASNVMADMLTEITANYLTLDLTEDQEVFFTKLIEDGAKRLGSANELLKKVQLALELTKDKMEASNISAPPEQDNNDSLDNDIELF